MRLSDDEISEQLLDRAIREINDLTHELQECSSCPRGSLMPVLGSGYPQADIMMLKYGPVPTEIEEGVAFYGRAGSALIKALKRLAIDPMEIYGTLCLKCPVVEPKFADRFCVDRLAEEISIISPRIVVVMGQQALDCLNELSIPLSQRVDAKAGELQQLTPGIDALYVPDIDNSLDDDQAKQEFWQAFRKLGDWYDQQPPY